MNSIKYVLLLFLVFCVGIGFAYADDEKDSWEQEVSLGYTQKTGNTQSSELLSSYEGINKTDAAELTLKGNVLYSSVNKKMDGQKYKASVRYAPTLEDTDWFAFGKFEIEHDRFAGIDYRYIPSVGAGRWFIPDEEDWKASAEVGVGHEYVEYTNGSDDSDVVLIPRFYYERPMFEKALLSEELIVYPNLEDIKEYRIRSETRFTNPLNESLAMRISFIDEFNSNPLGDAKKNDTQLVLSFVYGF